MGRERRVRKVENHDYDLNKLFGLFIAEKKRKGRAPDTIRNYQSDYQRFLSFLEGTGYSLKCADVTVEYVDDYMDYLQEDNGEDTLRPASVNNYLRSLRAFLYWCQDHYSMERFPVDLVQETEEIKETFTNEELRKLIRKPSPSAEFTEWRTWAITNWVLGTGNRCSTVCNVKLRDIDFETMEIHLTKTKNHREQIVPMSRELEAAISTFIQIWRSDAEDGDYLFCNVSADKLTPNALKHSFRDYVQSRGVTKTSIHTMRHTFAKSWVVNGGEITRLQMLLGHKTLEMTRHYVNMLVADLQINFDEFNPLDNLKKTCRREQRVIRNPVQRRQPSRSTSVC